MNKPIVVNLFGGPGSGKSTGSAYVFAMLKMHGINCELVTEFAKDKTWEHNMGALSNQAYVFGNQCYRMSRCADQVDVIITDSPLVLSVVYNKNSNPENGFNKMAIEVFNSYNNINFFLDRVKPYNPIGRNQTEEESDNIGHDIEDLLVKNGIEYTTVAGYVDGYEKIAKNILSILNVEVIPNVFTGGCPNAAYCV